MADDGKIEEDAKGPPLGEDSVRDALRTALDVAPPKSLVNEVQKRIRDRSRGQFYRDRWSTDEAPHLTYFVTAILMLVVLLAIMALLMPWPAR